jgi:hypothetical protein
LGFEMVVVFVQSVVCVVYIMWCLCIDPRAFCVFSTLEVLDYFHTSCSFGRRGLAVSPFYILELPVRARSVVCIPEQF